MSNKVYKMSLIGEDALLWECRISVVKCSVCYALLLGEDEQSHADLIHPSVS